MREQTEEQCSQWLHQHSIRADKRERSDLFHKGPNVYFHIPEQARAMVTLSYCLSDWIGTDEILLRITEWPISTDLEMQIFLEWRQRQGCHSRLLDAPGHLFPAGDDVVARKQLIFFLFAYNWEGYVYTADNRSFVWLADEVIEVATSTEQDADDLIDLLAEIWIQAEKVPPSGK